MQLNLTWSTSLSDLYNPLIFANNFQVITPFNGLSLTKSNLIEKYGVEVPASKIKFNFLKGDGIRRPANLMGVLSEDILSGGKVNELGRGYG